MHMNDVDKAVIVTWRVYGDADQWFQAIMPSPDDKADSFTIEIAVRVQVEFSFGGSG